jgi:Mg-chelatase subunit ChlD
MGKKQTDMDIFILLDRTGSMATLWAEAISSVNTYVKELAKDGADDRVTLAAFDHYGDGMQFDILRDSVPLGEWKAVADDEVLPRGMTPLYDALARIITRAEETGNAKTAIVVMTDGHENASSEVTKDTARAALDRVEKKNWQVTFLGANFDGFDQATGLGVQQGQVMNFFVGHGNAAMASTARAHQRYRQSANAVPYLDEDRNDAGEDRVK